MQRFGKTAITGVLVMLLAVDPAAAGRFRWFGGRGCCRPANVGCYGTSVHCPPVDACYSSEPVGCHSAPLEYGEVISEPLPSGDGVGPMPTPPTPPMEETQRPELPAETGAGRPMTDAGTPSPSDTDTIPTPNPPIGNDPPVPDVPDTNVIPDLIPDETPMPDSPMPDANAIPDLLDDIGTPDTAIPDVMPDETPMPDTPMPDAIPDVPATENIDDLFNDSSSTELPADDTAVTPASAETPVLESASPDAATPVEATIPAADDIDSLFEEPAAEAPNVEEPMMAVEPTREFDLPPADSAEPAAEDTSRADLSKANDELAAAEVGSATQGRRTWTDNTGAYQIEAKLLVILDGKVRLLKDTGRTTTVPFNRLSDTDRTYVQSQAKLLAVSKAKTSEF